MTINKFQGKTKEEAIAKAKKEFGENAVIMNVKEVKPKGMLAIFKSSTYEVTAAMEEKDTFSGTQSVLKGMDKKHDSINLSADEKIELPKPERMKGIDSSSNDVGFDVQKLLQKEIKQAKSELGIPEKKAQGKENQSKEAQNREIQNKEVQDKEIQGKHDNVTERLDKITYMLDEKEEEPDNSKKSLGSDELNFVKILYNTLINNEVNEKYVNLILDDIEKFLKPGNSLDTILSNVYQKLMLRFGQPSPITMAKNKPKVVFFVGPTGVGKTTTIAKIASKYKVEMNKQVAFLTADTYRIAATEQLRVYANILDAPMAIIYSQDELNSSIERFLDSDLIFVDTAGFSHKNEAQCEDMRRLIQGIDAQYEKEVFLVLSATTKYKDLMEIVDIYHEISDYKLIFTKLDETSNCGNMFNVKLYSGAEMSYVTNGQNVPEDIEIFDTQKMVKQLLGGK